jgi:G:T-mismatch repair DNA endonuclease (very short patch repair protein)
LKSLGWRVLVVWECELRNPQLEARLISFVAKES